MPPKKAIQVQNPIHVQEKLLVDRVQNVVTNNVSETPLKFEPETQNELNQFWSMLSLFAKDLDEKLPSESVDAESVDALFLKIYKNFDTYGATDLKKKQEKVNIRTKRISKESLEQAVKFSADLANRFNSKCAFLNHQLLYQLSSVGKMFEILDMDANQNILQKILSKSETETNAVYFQAIAIRWHSLQAGAYQNFVFQNARRAHFEQVQEQRRKEKEKEQKEQKRGRMGASRHKEEVEEELDPEEAMFKEEKPDESAGQFDDTFDEEANDTLLKYKTKIINQPIFSSLVRVGLQCAARIQDQETSEDNLNLILLTYISETILQTITASPAQDRFEQTASLWLSSNVNELFASVINLNNPNSHMLEVYLFIFNQMLNNPRTLEQSQTIANNICDILISPRADEYVTSGCNYALARILSKNAIIAKNILNVHGEKLARTCASWMRKYGHGKSGFHTIPTYGALNALLGHMSPTMILNLDRDLNLTDLLLSDVKNQQWDVRYMAMVGLKVLCQRLCDTRDAAPVFRRLLMHRVLQIMAENLQTSRPQPSKDPKRESEKDRRQRGLEELYYNRYTMPASLAALNSVFHNARRNNDPENIELMKQLVAQDQKFQEMLGFLSFVESKKHQQLVSAKTIGLLIAMFLLFLIAMPYLFSLLKSAK